ncbi:hypothetical protein PL81_35585 [Streptomyces sp. RSD-27]|nr:hypothetical protein PL81_35585 [Streptomyces sp. RSD-27]
MRTSGVSRGSSGEWEKPFWQQRGWLLSAAFLLSMFVIGGFVLLTDENGGGGSTGQPQPSMPTASGLAAAGPSAAQPGPREGRPAGCSTNDSDQGIPQESPSDLRWKVYQTDLLPVSPAAGPLKFDGGVWSCYSRTPLGAVLALQAISSKMSSSDWKAVTEKQLARGPGKDQFVAKRSKLPDSNQTGAPGSRGGYVGFRVLTYSKDQATAMILMRLADGTYGVATMSAVWEDGDWKLRPTLSGSITESITAVGGPEGFTAWGGGSGS